DIEKLDINAVCFGILCNFTPVCGEERAKEAVELVRTLQAENERLRAELKSKVDLVFQQAKELDRRHLLLQEQEAELERVKRALAMMWFAYVNSDKETPHSYETDALEEAEHILGPWAKCMPKYLRRGPEEG
ncbi:hypothetical protein H7U40_18535, partial [Flavonifractor plautii]|uniref:hypothetical protein n=1 Tax=Flavonifractor plautii TaxID=292800 RepID=UPI001957F297